MTQPRDYITIVDDKRREKEEEKKRKRKLVACVHRIEAIRLLKLR